MMTPVTIALLGSMAAAALWSSWLLAVARRVLAEEERRLRALVVEMEREVDRILRHAARG